MSNRVRFASTLSLAVLAACLAAVAHGQQTSTQRTIEKQATGTGTLVLQLLEEDTGYGVAGTVGLAPASKPWSEYLTWTQNSPQSPTIPLKQQNADASGKLVLKLPPGNYLIEVSAPGHQPMRSYTSVPAGKSSTGSFTLHPNETPEDLKQVNSLARPGFASAAGYVLDATMLRPIAAAQIQDKNAGAVATTNARGFYVLEVPLKEPPDDECHDTIVSLFVKAPRYKEVVGRRQLLNNNDVSIGVNFWLEHGTGTEENPEEIWESADPTQQSTNVSNASNPPWWDVKPPRRSQRKPTEEIKKWQALAPEIEKALRPRQEDCGGNYGIHAGIFDAAKFPDNGPEVALVDACPLGAYTDLVLAMQLDNGKPVLSKTQQKNGTRGVGLEFASGSSVMNTADVRLVPEDKAIYSIDYSTDGCTHLMRCRVDAYAWNAETGTFRSDAALTRKATQGYCRSVQQGLSRSPRNAGVGVSPAK
jgi:hypothetical protein